MSALRYEGFAVVATGNENDFLAQCEPGRADIAIVDLGTSIEHQHELLPKVKELIDGRFIIGLTSRSNIEGAINAMKLGALDVVTRPIKSEPLVVAIRNVLHRGFRTVIDAAGHAKVEAVGFHGLSVRERAVVHLIAEGCNNEAIAGELGISHRTVETHRYNAMDKLGARNAADLLRLLLLIQN